MTAFRPVHFVDDNRFRFSALAELVASPFDSREPPAYNSFTVTKN